MPKPVLSYTYDSNDPKLLQTVLPYIGAIETTADTISLMLNDEVILNAEIVAQLKEEAQSKKILVHGVGLSIGSYNGYSQAYIALMDELYQEVPLYWHSEHLGYTTVNGENINVMLPINRNEECLSMICDRVEKIQKRYPIPFLLENIAHLLPDYNSTYSEAGFLNAIIRNTGCGLILDIYNIACDVHNFGFKIDEFLAELNLDAVKEIHLANGSIYKGKMMDIHSRAVSDEVLEKTKEILPSLKNLEVVTYELMPEAVPSMGYENIEKELIRIKSRLEL
jgi:uncharacterized protein (UPF0276 family)